MQPSQRPLTGCHRLTRLFSPQTNVKLISRRVHLVDAESLMEAATDAQTVCGQNDGPITSQLAQTRPLGGYRDANTQSHSQMSQSSAWNPSSSTSGGTMLNASGSRARRELAWRASVRDLGRAVSVSTPWAARPATSGRLSSSDSLVQSTNPCQTHFTPRSSRGRQIAHGGRHRCANTLWTE